MIHWKQALWSIFVFTFVQATRSSRKLERAHFQRFWKHRTLKMGSSTHAKPWSRPLTGTCSATAALHMLQHSVLSSEPWSLRQQPTRSRQMKCELSVHCLLTQQGPANLCSYFPRCLLCTHILLHSVHAINLTILPTLPVTRTNEIPFLLLSLEQANNLREVQAMKRLSPHANIIQLHELILWVLHCCLVIVSPQPTFMWLVMMWYFSDKESGTASLICELMEMNIYELIQGMKSQGKDRDTIYLQVSGWILCLISVLHYFQDEKHPCLITQ